MRERLRATAAVLGLCAATAAVCAVWQTADLALRLAGRPRGRARDAAMRAGSRAVVALAGARVKVVGPAPKPPFLLVANHLSYFDVPVISTAVDCRYVAKSDISRWPLIGALCRLVGVIFVDRERRFDVVRVNDLVRGALEAGDGVVLFPEGTSTNGESVVPFRASLLDFAARTKTPVHYAALTYRTPDRKPHASDAVCWWGTMTFPGHLFRLFTLGGLDATLTFGETPIAGDDRKALARDLHSAVGALFDPVTRAEEQCLRRKAS